MKDPRTKEQRKADKAADLELQKTMLRAWGLYGFHPEWHFTPGRRWAFDWAWPESKVALEVEGGGWRGMGHAAPVRFHQDIEKYNAAVLLGWAVIRCTPEDFRGGKFAVMVQTLLRQRGRIA